MVVHWQNPRVVCRIQTSVFLTQLIDYSALKNELLRRGLLHGGGFIMAGTFPEYLKTRKFTVLFV